MGYALTSVPKQPRDILGESCAIQGLRIARCRPDARNGKPGRHGLQVQLLMYAHGEVRALGAAQYLLRPRRRTSLSQIRISDTRGGGRTQYRAQITRVLDPVEPYTGSLDAFLWRGPGNLCHETHALPMLDIGQGAHQARFARHAQPIVERAGKLRQFLVFLKLCAVAQGQDGNTLWPPTCQTQVESIKHGGPGV